MSAPSSSVAFVQLDTPKWDAHVLTHELPEFKEWPAGVIVAGGALFNWAYRYRALPDSDVDLWCFDRPTFVHTVKMIIDFWRERMGDQKGFSFRCTKLKVEFTRPHCPALQVMFWPNRTPESLVSSFDIDACRVYTDGKDRFFHPTAAVAWTTMTVRDVTSPIPANRIIKMLQKGFSVNLPAGVLIDPNICNNRTPQERTDSDEDEDAVEALAGTIEGISLTPGGDSDVAKFWEQYHLRVTHHHVRSYGTPVDYTFQTEIVEVSDNPRKVGVISVPPELEKAMIHTRLLYFIHVAANVPVKQAGMATLTVRLYGGLRAGKMYPAMRVIAWI